MMAWSDRESFPWREGGVASDVHPLLGGSSQDW